MSLIISIKQLKKNNKEIARDKYADVIIRDIEQSVKECLTRLKKKTTIFCDDCLRMKLDEDETKLLHPTHSGEEWIKWSDVESELKE